MVAHFFGGEVILARYLFCGIWSFRMGIRCLKGLSVISVRGKMGDLNHDDYAGITQPNEFSYYI